MPQPKLAEAIGFFRPAGPARAPHAAFVTGAAASLETAFVTKAEGANFCVLANMAPEGTDGAEEAAASLMEIGGMISAYMRSRASADDAERLFDASVWAQTLQHIPLWNESLAESDKLGISSKAVGAGVVAKAAAALPARIGISDGGVLADRLAAAIIDAWPKADGTDTGFAINILLLVVNGGAAPNGSELTCAVGLFTAARAGGGPVSILYGNWNPSSASPAARQQVQALLSNAPKDVLTNTANFIAWPAPASGTIERN